NFVPQGNGRYQVDYGSLLDYVAAGGIKDRREAREQLLQQEESLRQLEETQLDELLNAVSRLTEVERFLQEEFGVYNTYRDISPYHSMAHWTFKLAMLRKHTRD
ncbi:unnamed protein product, partial [Amoebophrya sp. A25]